MLSAWVELVPQYEGARNVIDAPEIIAVADAGLITFANR
jgi:hypothetical protein